MGTWDDGLLDNDVAMDGLGDLRHGLAEDIERIGAASPAVATTAELAAAVGILLQLSSYEFGLDTSTGPKIAAAVKAHADEIAKLPQAARSVLDGVAAGEGHALAERPGETSAELRGLLNKAAKKPRFGKREPALFASAAGAAYVQTFAESCVARIDEDFEDEHVWSDLCREGMNLGCLAVLAVLEPCNIPVKDVERWRAAAKAGLATLVESEDDELDFQRGYYANLDAVLAILEKRFTA